MTLLPPPDAKHPGRAKVRPAKDALFLPFQAKWVKDDSPLKIAEKSRQIGWSWGTAYRQVRKKSQRGARNDSWISSRDEIQARLFLDDCKAFAAVLQRGAEDLGERVIDSDGHTAYVLRLATGVRINSMSSNPDAQAGKRGDRVLDEFALHKDPLKLYSIAYPGTTWGGSLEIFSTHRGSLNFFNQLIKEIREGGNPKGFSYHRVTLQDALEQGLLFKLQQKLPKDHEVQGMDEAEYFDHIRSKAADEESFLQEYMCVPADDNSAFLTYDLILACEYPRTERWELSLAETTGPLYVGVDVGREHDLTVIWVLEQVGDVLHTRRVITLKAQAYSVQEAELYQILQHSRVHRCCIDATGIGSQFAERARERFGWKAEAVKFTPAVKEELAFPLRTAFEDRTIRIPESQEIRADLRAVRKEHTATGNLRITADRGPGGHSDRFWALALARHAAGIKREVGAMVVGEE